MSKKLSFCLRAVKTLNDGDLDALTGAIEGYAKAGMPTEQAETAAINDLLADLASERTDLVGLLREQHTDLFSLLSNPTVQGLREQEAAAKKAEAADKAEQKRLADKAKADAEVGEFKLTGSDRAADAPDQFGLPGLSIAPPTDTNAFKKWFGESKVVDEDGNPLVVFHGTMTDFSTFDRSRANPESDMGAGFYFSNTAADVEHNYAGEGPDMQMKIEMRAEQIEQEEEFEGSHEDAVALARKEFSEHSGATMPVYLSLQNPLQIGGENDTFLAYEQEYDEETDDYGEEKGALVDLLMALQNMGGFDDINYGKITESLSDAMGDGGIRASKLIPLLKESEGLVYATDENGKLASTEIIRQALQEAGFDGIIDHTVDVKFGSQKRIGKAMKGMHEEATHFIAFEPEQIKSAIGNAGTYDATNPDIRADFSGAPGERIPVGDAMPAGEAPAAHVKALQGVQDAYRGAVADFKNLVLTALPAVEKPAAAASQATKERYAAQEFAKLFGNQVGYFAANMQRFAEGVAPLGNQKLIFINEATTRPVMAVTGHELLHSMRESHPGLYAKFDQRMSSILKNPEAHHSWLAAMYRTRGIPALSNDKLREELYGDIVGDVFTDPKAMQQLLRAISQDQPGLFQRVMAFLRDFLDSVLAKLKNERPYGTERYLKDIEAARDAVVATMKEFAQRQQASQQERAPNGQFVAEPAMASVNGEAFYSELARQVEQTTMKSAPADGWLQWLKGMVSKGTIKADEIAWTGIEDWLKLQTGKVSRDQVLDYLKANGVQVTETMLGGEQAEPKKTFSIDSPPDEDLYDVHSPDGRLLYTGTSSAADEFMEEWMEREAGQDGATKYSQYTLPGGKNYQELLLTLPDRVDKSKLPDGMELRKGTTRAWEVYGKNKPELGRYSHGATEDEAISNFWKTHPPGNEYKSSHWPDTHNILAHVRFNERTDADGKRVLFIEEIQSDWAQDGKKQGFFEQQPEPKGEVRYEPDKDADHPWGIYINGVEKNRSRGNRTDASYLLDEEMERARSAKPRGVPAAPFVTKTDAWVSLAIKRMVRYAAENDFDRVAFVNGDQSADRYDLSKHIKEFRYEPTDTGKYEVGAVDHEGKNVLEEDEITIERIEELVGKEIAQKVLAREGAKDKDTYRDWHYLRGLDLKVGGEGMKAFYDKIVPKVVKEVTKKLGGQIGVTSVVSRDTIRGNEEYAYSTLTDLTATGPKYSVIRVDNDEVAAGPFKTWEEANAWLLANDPVLQTKQLAIDITPKMRDAAGGGLPMFSLAPNTTPPRENLARAFQRKLQDSFNRFTVIKKWAEKQGLTLGKDSNVWAYEERMHSRIATRVKDFREKRVKPAIQAIQKAGYTMEQVAEFLHAQHAEERNKQIESIDPATKDGSGMKTADAKAILARSNPKLIALANDFRRITDETRQLLLDAGIIDQDMVNAWQKAYSNYVPLKGGDEEKAAKTGTGKGLNVAGKQKRALGHGEREENIIENIMRDHERAITLSEKNRVGHSLLSFIADLANPEVATIGQPEKRKVLVKGTNYEVREQNGARIGIFDTLPAAKKFLAYSQANGLLAHFGSPLTIEPVRADPSVAYMASPQLADNEVNVYVDGHTVRVQLNDELLARAYTRSGVERVNQLMAINREINNFLSKAYTGYNPEFFFTNVIRDFTTGLINVTGNFGGKVTARAIANYPKAFASLIRYSVTGKETPEIKDYRAAGGSTGSAYLSDIERIGTDIQKSYDDYRGVMATLKGSGTVRAGRVAARKMAGSVLQVMEHLNAAGESAMRLSVFESVRTTPGYSDDDAASAAKNSTVNFNRKGEWGPVMGAMYLFFNPAVQGTAAMMDAAVNGKHKHQARALLAALPALAYALTMQFGGGDEDDEFWKAIPDSTKDKNLVIRTGKKSYITIPVPYGPGFLFSLGNSLRSLQLGEDVSKVSLNVASNMLEHFSPIGNPLGGDKADTRGLVELIPGALGGELMRDVVRLAANRNGLGGDIVPDSPFDKDKPDNLKMFRSTKGSIYEKVAKFANSASGGTAALPGAVDVSPESLKFWVRAITGGSGAFLVDSTTLGANAARYATSPNDPDRAALKPEKSEIPIARRFFKDETIGDRRRLFWQAVKEVETAEANLERARKLDDEAGIERVESQNGELLAMGEFADAQKKAVKAQRDAVEEIMADTTTSLASKRARVKELEQEEAGLYNEFVREFTQAKKAKATAGATP